jgi:lysophospholipase L1-like esterase
MHVRLLRTLGAFLTILFVGCSRHEVDPTPSQGLFPGNDLSSRNLLLHRELSATSAVATTGDNILDPSNSNNLADTYVNERYNGLETALAGWTTFDYTPVVAGIVYASNNLVTHSAWFDAQKQFLAPFGNGLAPAGAAFVRVSVQAPAAATTMLIYGGNVPPTYHPYFGQGCGSAATGDNILNPSNSNNLADTYVNERYNGLETALAGWTTFDYTPVVAGIVYASNNLVTHSAWFDAQKQFLAPFGNGLAPAGAAFVRVSVQAPAAATTMLIYGGNVPPVYHSYYCQSSPPHQPFAGMKAVVLGTSLTFQHKYVDYMQTRTGLASIVNKGVSGQLLVTMADNLTAADLQDAAFVSIEGPTNDYGHGSATAGQVTNSAGSNTICSNLKYVVDKIRTLNSTVPIIIINDTWRGAFGSEPVAPAPNPYGLTLAAACQAMMDEAQYLGLAHWDAYNLSTITQQNVSQNTEDLLHWNDAGAQLVGNGYGDYINSLR